MMTEDKIFEATICHDYDMIHNTLIDEYYDAFTVANIMNKLIDENRRLSKALTQTIAQKMNVDKEIRRIKHELYSGDVNDKN